MATSTVPPHVIDTCAICQFLIAGKSYRQTATLTGHSKSAVERHNNAYTRLVMNVPGQVPAPPGPVPAANPPVQITVPVPTPPPQPLLPPRLQRAYDYMAFASNMGLKVTLKEVVDFLNEATTKEVPTYTRPPMLNAKQNQIIDTIELDNVRLVAIEGPRRSGKSNCWFVAARELGFCGYTHWGLWGAKEDSASIILRQMSQDKVSRDQIGPLIAQNSIATILRFKDGVDIRAHATVPADAKGFAYMGVIIEEADQVIAKHPDVIGIILGIMRSEPNMKIILVMNRDSGPYKLVRDALLNDERLREKCRFFTLDEVDSPHIAATGNDDIIEPLMRALVGKDKTDEQLHNIESQDGELFNVNAMMHCFNEYDEWMRHVHLLDDAGQRTRKRPARTVVSVDPGFGHPTGIFVASMIENHIYEEESWEYCGKDDRGVSVTEDFIKTRVAELARKYGAHIICESNSGGLFWMQFWKQYAGLKGVYAQNFGGEGKANDRVVFVKKMNQLIEEQRFHFKSDDLRTQLMIYNPAERDTTENSGKGDKADASIHAVWFLTNQAKNDGKKQSWDGR